MKSPQAPRRYQKISEPHHGNISGNVINAASLVLNNFLYFFNVSMKLLNVFVIKKKISQ